MVGQIRPAAPARVAGQVTKGSETHLGDVFVHTPPVQVAALRQAGRGSFPYSQVRPSLQGQVSIWDKSGGQGDAGAHALSEAFETPAFCRTQALP